jgi:hypothetical protein
MASHKVSLRMIGKMTGRLKSQEVECETLGHCDGSKKIVVDSRALG